ncbi:MAG: AAA family ATPase [Chlorobi bacterium]|nr:AAA family ATPase [Chlorobiota bacterium]
MRILEFAGFDAGRYRDAYIKVSGALQKHDFRAAQVKKLVNLTHGRFYRARLDDAARLLFTLVRHGDETCILMLEVIANHAYDRSRFLRGMVVDESKIPDAPAADAIADAQVVRYLHPERTTVYMLDKPISFDDAQERIYRQPSPLIIVGSAGSGKTALTLEKLKHTEGEVLYVTHSAYLAGNARNLYYANGFEHPGQEAHFLSYREFVESIRVPAGREVTWRDFSGWFARMRNLARTVGAHQAFEEIRGVITAGAEGTLSREAYMSLGVRQSIFTGAERCVIYDLFEKYRQWTDEAGFYDLNSIAHRWQEIARSRYDFVVVDEVQDLTPVQLALILGTLKHQGHFLLSGDSNQIVHPNFFSWSQIKSLFWNNPDLARRQQLSVLTANFRNGKEATRLANRLLRIKQQRFGSIDRESNFLVDAVGGESGEVVLMADIDAVKGDLNRKTRNSTRFAVLVMRDEDKAEARKYFSTPLLFSIHEAKGLEYDNIVLFRFISGNRAEFTEIVEGVEKSGLDDETLGYSRAKDKSDKSMEIYRFFINAFYVALTRAIRNLYIIEADTQHRLFGLLDLAVTRQVKVGDAQSTIEEWQKEARKLELQGKQEQVDAIRHTILKQVPPKWPVFNEGRLKETLIKVFRDDQPGNKLKQQLYEYATCHDEPMLAEHLHQQVGYMPACRFSEQRPTLGRKSYVPYFSQQIKTILRQCDLHGVDHRLFMNQTPLMAAAAAGNVPLTEALLERGANPQMTDHYGYNALHWAMREAFREPKFARGNFATLYEQLAPACIDVNTGNRLVRIDRHLSEYFLFQTLWVLFKTRFTYYLRRPYAAFESRAILDAWEHMPANAVYPERNRRQHLSGVLARNEVKRDYAFNRHLFVRIAQGWYQFNPALSIRAIHREEGPDWVPVYEALNLPLIHEFVNEDVAGQLREYCVMAGMQEPSVPLCIEKAFARKKKLSELLNSLSPAPRLRRMIEVIEPDDQLDEEIRDDEDEFNSATEEWDRARESRRMAREAAKKKKEALPPPSDQLSLF